MNVLIDVRKNAYSMKYGFSGSQISRNINKLNIEYLHIPNLGIESSKRKNLSDEEDYRSLFSEYEAQLPNKTKELDEIRRLAEIKKVALMCFEKDSSYCHRGIIGKKLLSEGYEVVNI
ncbi:DUF488 family protein [Methanolacinia petrolearia]|uniref:DUF488 domain-containing protein n=1 Tax=Methanolacinia petrolearia TaxID=54120 RepID=UPI003BAC7EC4